MALSLRTLVVFMLRHFFAPFLLDRTHGYSLFVICGRFESVNDFIERNLDDARRTGLGKRGDKIADLLLLDDGLDGEPLLVVELVYRRSVKRGKNLDDLVERLRGGVAFEKHAALGLKSARQKHLELLKLGALGLVLPARLVGDESGRRGKNRIDDAEIVGAERTAGLGKIDDRVDELGSLDLGRTPAKLDVGLDAVLLEIALDEADGLCGNTLAVQILDGLDLRIVRNGENPTDGIRGRLGIVKLADLFDVAAVFVDPVKTADTRVKKTELDITAHLLGSQESTLDLFVVDRRNITAA